MEKRTRRSSILKKTFTEESSPTQTFTRSKRRISFSEKKFVKEFMPGDDGATIWINSYDVSTEGKKLSTICTKQQEIIISKAIKCPSTNSKHNLKKINNSKEEKAAATTSTVNEDGHITLIPNEVNNIRFSAVQKIEEQVNETRSRSSSIESQSISCSLTLIADESEKLRNPKYTDITLADIVSEETNAENVEISDENIALPTQSIDFSFGKTLKENEMLKKEQDCRKTNYEIDEMSFYNEEHQKKSTNIERKILVEKSTRKDSIYNLYDLDLSLENGKTEDIAKESHKRKTSYEHATLEITTNTTKRGDELKNLKETSMDLSIVEQNSFVKNVSNKTLSWLTNNDIEIESNKENLPPVKAVESILEDGGQPHLQSKARESYDPINLDLTLETIPAIIEKRATTYSPKDLAFTQANDKPPIDKRKTMQNYDELDLTLTTHPNEKPIDKRKTIQNYDELDLTLTSNSVLEDEVNLLFEEKNLNKIKLKETSINMDLSLCMESEHISDRNKIEVNICENSPQEVVRLKNQESCSSNNTQKSQNERNFLWSISNLTISEPDSTNLNVPEKNDHDLDLTLESDKDIHTDQSKVLQRRTTYSEKTLDITLEKTDIQEPPLEEFNLKNKPQNTYGEQSEDMDLSTCELIVEQSTTTKKLQFYSSKNLDNNEPSPLSRPADKRKTINDSFELDLTVNHAVEEDQHFLKSLDHKRSRLSHEEFDDCDIQRSIKLLQSRNAEVDTHSDNMVDMELSFVPLDWETSPLSTGNNFKLEKPDKKRATTYNLNNIDLTLKADKEDRVSPLIDGQEIVSDNEKPQEPTVQFNNSIQTYDSDINKEGNMRPSCHQSLETANYSRYNQLITEIKNEEKNSLKETSTTGLVGSVSMRPTSNVLHSIENILGKTSEDMEWENSQELEAKKEEANDIQRSVFSFKLKEENIKQGKENIFNNMSNEIASRSVSNTFQILNCEVELNAHSDVRKSDILKRAQRGTIYNLDDMDKTLRNEKNSNMISRALDKRGTIYVQEDLNLTGSEKVERETESLVDKENLLKIIVNSGEDSFYKVHPSADPSTDKHIPSASFHFHATEADDIELSICGQKNKIEFNRNGSNFVLTSSSKKSNSQQKISFRGHEDVNISVYECNDPEELDVSKNIDLQQSGCKSGSEANLSNCYYPKKSPKKEMFSSRLSQSKPERKTVLFNENNSMCISPVVNSNKTAFINQLEATPDKDTTPVATPCFARLESMEDLRCSMKSSKSKSSDSNSLFLPNTTDYLCNIDFSKITNKGYRKNLEDRMSWQRRKSSIELALPSILDTSKDDIEKTRLSLIESLDLSDSFVTFSPSTEKPLDDDSPACVEANKNDTHCLTSGNLISSLVGICRRCRNCQITLEHDTTEVEQYVFAINAPKRKELDFSPYEKFRNVPSVKDVLAAYKKRRESDNFEHKDEESVLFPTVPTVKFLLENYISEYSPKIESEIEVGATLPLVPSLEFLLENKIESNCSNWKFNGLFMPIGLMEFKHSKLSNISLMLEFPAKAFYANEDKIIFNKVVLQKTNKHELLSALDTVVQKELFSKVPCELTNHCSSLNELFDFLEYIHGFCESAIKYGKDLLKVAITFYSSLETDQSGNCFVRKSIKKRDQLKKTQARELLIQIRNVSKISYKDVILPPISDFKEAIYSVPKGLQFLQVLLSDPFRFLIE